MTLDQPSGPRTISFAKGHGTGNDFIIIEDPDAKTPLSADDVRSLCDRRFGIGGDGVLRAVRAGYMPEWAGDPRLWFMDYRNSDGSVAEMCGNGLRVFVRYMVDEGLLPSRCVVATRAGLRAATAHADCVSIEAGVPRFLDPVTISLGGVSWRATHVDMGNPHAVVLLDKNNSKLDLEAIPVHEKPRWEPRDAYPNDTNVEFVLPTGAREVSMRVHERGSGETLSCGTGIVASAAAFAHSRGEDEGTYTVNVPGGRATVELRKGKSALLTAPALIVFRGTVSLPFASVGVRAP